MVINKIKCIQHIRAYLNNNYLVISLKKALKK